MMIKNNSLIYIITIVLTGIILLSWSLYSYSQPNSNKQPVSQNWSVHIKGNAKHVRRLSHKQAEAIIHGHNNENNNGHASKHVKYKNNKNKNSNRDNNLNRNQKFHKTTKSNSKKSVNKHKKNINNNWSIHIKGNAKHVRRLSHKQAQTIIHGQSSNHKNNNNNSKQYHFNTQQPISNNNQPNKNPFKKNNSNQSQKNQFFHSYHNKTQPAKRHKRHNNHSRIRKNKSQLFSNQKTNHINSIKKKLKHEGHKKVKIGSKVHKFSKMSQNNRFGLGQQSNTYKVTH